ncbi:hormogonium polysaccharide biosynthesis glycosyltransferase HpsN [Oscillatoria sp. FACHB-1406]|uniref:hormogonium polysaccharide biosynthesis glycosyltransferase HpsN n=1 Tax=Oscillatoria sp. FACHB-1406 TaxID=2692846 RepID=UPI001685808D|nr:hormogonium polysaccharide biosynthesis glycosyltransferase HpsN [Oscillatoria sp. FACHB-1406]MBD2576868.1 glycosyltransferase family 2 protein [Oscillatoria sp. FACHB-1406]
MNVPLISVIIPTYGREVVLRDTLMDVIEQDYPNYEVIVVDQTPTHEAETETVLQQLADAGKIQWFRVNWANLPGARNYAVRRAKGEILLFIDDDVKLPPGYLQAHARNFVERPEVGVVAGRVFDRMKLKDAQNGCGQLSGEPDSNSPEIEFLPPEAMDPGIAWYYIDLVHTTKPQRVLSARGCNMAFRRDIFYDRGLWFDERFRGSAVREESDFCLRLRQTGYEIWYDPEAHLVHLGEMSGGCHDISTRSLQYQVAFYHNHFLLALKNLTWNERLRLFSKLFDCHVLGNPPCYKEKSLQKTIVRGAFYGIGLLDAIATQIKSLWDDGQIYTRQDTVISASKSKVEVG